MKSCSDLKFFFHLFNCLAAILVRETNEENVHSGVVQSDLNLRIVVENTNCNAWIG